MESERAMHEIAAIVVKTTFRPSLREACASEAPLRVCAICEKR